jgi:hypothetical protein
MRDKARPRPPRRLAFRFMVSRLSISCRHSLARTSVLERAHSQCSRAHTQMFSSDTQYSCFSPILSIHLDYKRSCRDWKDPHLLSRPLASKSACNKRVRQHSPTTRTHAQWIFGSKVRVTGLGTRALLGRYFVAHPSACSAVCSESATPTPPREAPRPRGGVSHRRCVESG